MLLKGVVVEGEADGGTCGLRRGWRRERKGLG